MGYGERFFEQMPGQWLRLRYYIRTVLFHFNQRISNI
jgi:hypothetical protein